MVPLPRFSTVNGVPITELIPADRIEALCKRTQNGGIEIAHVISIQPGFELFRRVLVRNPVSEGRALRFLGSEIQKTRQPALMLLGKMQIGKARELRFRSRQRRPAIALDQVKRHRQAGAVLAAGTFDHKGMRRGGESRHHASQHGARRQLARIQHGVEMGGAQRLLRFGFIPPTLVEMPNRA